MRRQACDISILYLEDEVLVALDTSEHLGSHGFKRVETYHRLARAEAAVRRHEFDVAILDINVNDGQNSKDLGRALKAAGTNVIFASGYTSEAAALKEEGFCFLPKPYSFTELDRLLDKLTE